MSFSIHLQRKGTHVPIRFGRSLLMVRPLRAGTSSASPQGVESPVNRCTQAFHRTAFTPLERRGKIVDMIASVGVVIAAAVLYGLPRANKSRLQLLRPSRAGSDWMWGRLGLLVGAARVDGAVELVFL